MLSEKQLAYVQGGFFIELSGVMGFLGGVFGGAIFGVGGGTYEAHDSMGHYGHVNKVEAKVKPAGFGSPCTVKKEEVTVLNSDNMSDLEGAHLTLGVTASLPQVVQDGISQLCGRASTYFGLVTSHGSDGVGAEISIPIINSKGIHENALIKTSTTTDSLVAVVPKGSGMYTTGVEVYAGVSATKVTVDKTDQMESYCYAMTHSSKDGK